MLNYSPENAENLKIIFEKLQLSEALRPYKHLFIAAHGRQHRPLRQQLRGQGLGLRLQEPADAEQLALCNEI